MTAGIIERIHSLQLFTESKAELLTDSKDKESAKSEVDRWTWFDLAVLDKGNLKAPKISHGNELMWMSHKNEHGKKELGWVGLLHHYHEICLCLPCLGECKIL